MIFFGPLVALPTDGLSSHNAHLTLGRTKARVSMFFRHAARVVEAGVVLNEVYLTGICMSAICVIYWQTYVVEDILDDDGGAMRADDWPIRRACEDWTTILRGQSSPTRPAAKPTFKNFVWVFLDLAVLEVISNRPTADIEARAKMSVSRRSSRTFPSEAIRLCWTGMAISTVFA